MHLNHSAIGLVGFSLVGDYNFGLYSRTMIKSAASQNFVLMNKSIKRSVVQGKVLIFEG